MQKGRINYIIGIIVIMLLFSQVSFALAQNETEVVDEPIPYSDDAIEVEELPENEFGEPACFSCCETDSDCIAGYPPGFFCDAGLCTQGEDKPREKLRCLQCGDSCLPYETVVAASCVKPTKYLECGVEKDRCVVLSSEDIVEEDFEIEDGGITPDNPLYFIDTFFDRFGNDLEVKEERIAEIKAMIQAGNYEAAEKAMDGYREQVDELRKEIDPDDIDQARASKVIVDHIIGEMGDDIAEIDAEIILDAEENVLTAGEIAGKIKGLCQALSNIDPIEYGKLCRTEDESPKWQKKLDRHLTDQQRDEAKNFGRIMEECFRTSGQNCDCGSIPFPDFARHCSKAAPLATACDIEGDEVACEMLDDLDMPELPDHLQDIMDDLERGMMDSKMDIHMPPECVQAGANTKRACSKIMVLTHAPPECKDALLELADQGETDKRVFEAACEQISMQMHAPECAEAGIMDPDECQDYMFNIDRRPQECIDNQIHDIRDCKDFMDSQAGRGPGPRIDVNCARISEPMERLACYDRAATQVQGYQGFEGGPGGNCMTEEDWRAKKIECRSLYGEHAGDEPIMGDSGMGYECVVDARCIDFGQYKDDDYNMKHEEIKQRERQCANDCSSRGGAWDFRQGICTCDTSQFGGEDYVESECKDGCHQECPGASRTDCVDGGRRCACFYEDPTEPDDWDGGGGGEPSPEPLKESESEYVPDYEDYPEDAITQPVSEPETTEETTIETTTTDTSTDTTTTTETASTSESPAPSDSGATSDSGGDSGGGDSGATSDSGGGDSSGGDSGGGDSGGGDSGGGDSGGDSGGGDSGTTGEVVFTGNAFLDYYYS